MIISGVTTWRYDQNGNLLHLTDADNQAGNKPTIWTYNTRNQKLTVAYPGHNPASAVGDSDYDKKVFTYDDVGRPAVFYDQLGDTVAHTFDLAGRLLKRDYRVAVNSPSGTIADTDEMAYDDAGRLLTADSGRYNNTVTMVYGDGAGRVTSESITLTLDQQRTYTVQSEYDAAGNRNEITYPDGKVVTRSYTDRDQLYQIGYDSNNVATFAYDDGGRRTGRTLGDTASTATTWSYCGRQRQSNNVDHDEQRGHVRLYLRRQQEQAYRNVGFANGQLRLRLDDLRQRGPAHRLEPRR